MVMIAVLILFPLMRMCVEDFFAGVGKEIICACKEGIGAVMSALLILFPLTGQVGVDRLFVQ